MSKIAFLYPGQGAQVAGMGKDFYEKSPLAKEVFDKSCEILGQDMKHICFEENELLDRTDYTQAALVTTCMAMTKEIMARGLTPDMTAGLSLGEYCAITTAGGMELEDAIKMVWLRGNLMHNAVPEGKGGMAAVLGLSGEAVNEAIAYMEGVYVANYNCPGQIVITGDKEAVENAAPALKEAGAKRVIPLNVSGPFHSIYLKEAGEKLYQALSEVTLGELKIPYVTNVDASIVTDTTRTKELLKEQVYSSVLWEQSVRAMIADGVDVFVEIGPGKTLSGFMRKIDRNVKMFRIGTMEDIDKTVEAIKELQICLAKEGAAVAVHFHGNEEKALLVKKEIEEAGGKAEIFRANVADFEECNALVKAVAKTFGSIDILVNNAGITKDGLLMAMSEADFDNVIDTNLKGCFQMIRFASRRMMKQRYGRIINVSSVSGVAGNAGQANYSASKAGIIGLTKSAAKELASRGITCNAIAPGFVKTEMTDVLPDEVKENAKKQIPLGRFAEPEDIANAAVFLASDKASYITGQVLLVDGGMVM